jgi:chromate reductase, NAD(P)H dehydrogenase (quinone)
LDCLAACATLHFLVRHWLACAIIFPTRSHWTFWTCSFLYNEDNDHPGGPADVRRFRDAIRDCDGVVIATPEYNHGIPGVLKNALDWASRPYGKSVLINKPVLVISVSPAFTGGVRAHAQVNETLLSIPAHLIGGPQVVIAGISDKIKNGVLIDEANLSFALSAVRRMITMTRLGSHPIIG